MTLEANRVAFERYRFLPRSLRDVTSVDVRGHFCGMDWDAPFGLAPTGYTRLVHPVGELAAARAAEASGVPYVLSTMATTPLEAVAAVAPRSAWFQLYVLKDRGLTESLVERAAASGIRVLIISVDTAVAGRRLRDVRNGFTIPPTVRARTLLDIALHVRWWSALAASPPLELAHLAPSNGGQPTTIQRLNELFDPSVGARDLELVRSWWPGKLFVKGPLGPEDVKQAISAGADGVYLSNHGGRQLDRLMPAIDLVPAVRDALGDGVAIAVDSGIRCGGDVAIALALGADFCMVGRPYLYGLAAGGERGVRQVIEMLADELTRTLTLCGAVSLDELHAGCDSLVEVARDR